VKVGDLVKTRVPGFGTGNTARIGTVIDSSKFAPRGETGYMPVQVMHEDGAFLEWYPWQLETVQEI